jgi:hypothetical protein
MFLRYLAGIVLIVTLALWLWPVMVSSGKKLRDELYEDEDKVDDHENPTD